MKDQDNILIEQYVHGNMNDELRNNFELRLNDEPDLRWELELYKKAMQAIYIEGKASLKSKLKIKGELIDKRRKKIRRWILLGIPLALLSLFLWYKTLQRNTAEINKKQELPALNSHELSSDTLLKADNHHKEVSKPDSLAFYPQKENEDTKNKSTDELEKIFSSNYSTFKDPSIEPTVRGLTEKNATQDFLELYWNSNYSEALEVRTNLPATSLNDDNISFLIAISYLETNQPSRANAILIDIFNKDKTRFMQETEWYLALSYLKLSNWNEAEGILKNISKTASHKYKEKAQAILQTK